METKDREQPKEDVHQAKVLVRGSFKPTEIETRLLDLPFKVPAELRDKIEEDWKPRAEKGWFAGQLLRLNSYNLQNGKLMLTFETTDFKTYVGTRDFETLRKFGIEHIANPLSVSSVIRTVDNKMLIGLKKQGDAMGAIDAIGGYLDSTKDIEPTTGQPDIFRAAVREVEEEVGIKEAELKNGTVVGLSYEYAGVCHPVISFSFTTELTSIEAMNRLQEEMSIIVVEPKKIPENKGHEYLMDVFKQHYPEIEPDGRVTIALARKHWAGVDYQKEVLRTPALI